MEAQFNRAFGKASSVARRGCPGVSRTQHAPKPILVQKCVVAKGEIRGMGNKFWARLVVGIFGSRNNRPFRFGTWSLSTLFDGSIQVQSSPSTFISSKHLLHQGNKMPTKTRPIEKFTAAVGKCSKEVGASIGLIPRVELTFGRALCMENASWRTTIMFRRTSVRPNS